MRKFKCVVCGFIYDEAQGLTEDGIAPGGWTPPPVKVRVKVHGFA